MVSSHKTGYPCCECEHNKGKCAGRTRRGPHQSCFEQASYVQDAYRNIDDAAFCLLSKCVDDYASRILECIRDRVRSNVLECSAIAESNDPGDFTTGDVALAIGRAFGE